MHAEAEPAEESPYDTTGEKNRSEQSKTAGAPVLRPRMLRCTSAYFQRTPIVEELVVDFFGTHLWLRLHSPKETTVS